MLFCGPFAVAMLVLAGRMPAAGSGVGGEFLVLAGFLLAFSLGPLLRLAVARPSGTAWAWASVGAGRRVASFAVRGRLVTVRAIPLVLFVPRFLAVDRPRLRLRLWAGSAAVVLGTGGTGTALIVSGRPGLQDVGWGLVVTTAATVLGAPHVVGSTGWMLLRLPFAGHGAELAEITHDAGLVPVQRTLGVGDVAAARAALDAVPPSRAVQRLGAEASVLLAEERYAEAARSAAEVYAAAVVPGTRAVSAATYASALAYGALTGIWSYEEVRPPFDAAVREVRQIAPKLPGATILGALDALLRGDRERASEIAARAARLAPTELARARALALR